MILATHLGNHILMASDRRAMSCDLETGKMRISHDNEMKLKTWCRGAVAGTGEKVFLDRVTEYFEKFDPKDKQLNQMYVIYDELQARINEGIPKLCLINNSIIFSLFNGKETLLHSISMDQFFETFKENGVDMIKPKMRTIEPWVVDVTCFNIPPDMSNLQEFQRNLKGRSEFEDDLHFMAHYIIELKRIFAHQASIDPSVTASFDLFFQSCTTGESIGLHINNPLLGMPVPQDLNYWDRFKT